MACSVFLIGKLLSLLMLGTISLFCNAFSKVVVPAVYNEWRNQMPDWIVNSTIQELYGFSVFLYQKHNKSGINFIAKNRGLEAGVYLKYIVDHYHDFPDVAIFIHAAPEKHQPKWLQFIRCISPNASYININNVFINYRSIEAWRQPNLRIWIEQCYRDVLRIAWGLQGRSHDKYFNSLVPTSKPIYFSTLCCQQFILSRSKVLERPVQVWKELLRIIGEQDACHQGEPDYENLFFSKVYSKKVGKEPAILGGNGPGGMTQVLDICMFLQGGHIKRLTFLFTRLTQWSIWLT